LGLARVFWRNEKRILLFPFLIVLPKYVIVWPTVCKRVILLCDVVLQKTIVQFLSDAFLRKTAN
jgi:hypothetical protein